MRTAVVRIDVDPAGELSPEGLTDGLAALRAHLTEIPAVVLGSAGSREVQVHIETGDTEAAVHAAVRACAKAFGTEPVPGVVTYVSRGTDADAHGVLAGFGLRGELRREPDADGFDVVHVVLDRADLERVPESRIHTALEASLNCEVFIHTR
ncbi:hypothetical protein AB0H71_19570 [Nocardia sp. NPDC050697]|uniref:hypothetical protein n=1 Tax=Nocardia sp. NPDC050697 TaxID=3155158 RepID=UPI0033DAD2B4